MTKATANVILLIMAIVWAYLSVINNHLQEVSNNFIYLGVALASPDALKLIIDHFKGVPPVDKQ